MRNQSWIQSTEHPGALWKPFPDFIPFDPWHGLLLYPSYR